MLEYTLLDDGTMDTVVEFHCTRCNRTWEERFSDASDYRDEDGDLDLNAFVAELGICCEMCGDCDFDDDSDCEGSDVGPTDADRVDKGYEDFKAYMDDNFGPDWDENDDTPTAVGYVK